jgi:hypothetical protein
VAAWGAGVKSVRWTSSRPFGVGTTREVVLALSAATVRERYFGWDEGRRMSFYAEQINRPGLRRFAEDCEIEATASGSRFTWTVAFEVQPKLAPFARAANPVNRLVIGRIAHDAHSYFARLAAGRV